MDVAFPLGRDRQIPQSAGQLGRAFERTPISFARAGHVAPLLQGSAQIGIGFHRPRTKTQRLAISVRGLLQAAGLVVGHAQIEACLVRSSGDLDQLRAVLSRGAIVAPRERRSGQTFQRSSVTPAGS